MSNVRTIYLDWQTGAIKSDQTVWLRQYDHQSTNIVLTNYPKLDEYYLLVAMKEVEDGPIVEEAELLLTGPNWLIPNLYTQLAQTLTIQFCARSSLGDLEIHSAKVTIPVYPSLKHDGVQIGVDVAAPFDAYIAYMDQRLAEILEEI